MKEVILGIQQQGFKDIVEFCVLLDYVRLNIFQTQVVLLSLLFGLGFVLDLGFVLRVRGHIINSASPLSEHDNLARNCVSTMNSLLNERGHFGNSAARVLRRSRVLRRAVQRAQYFSDSSCTPFTSVRLWDHACFGFCVGHNVYFVMYLLYGNCCKQLSNLSHRSIIIWW